MSNKNTMNSIMDFISKHKTVSIYDFDGTMANTEIYHKQSFIYTLAHFGFSLENFQFDKYVGLPALVVFQKISEENNISFDINKAEAKRLEFFVKNAIDEKLQPYTQIKKTLVCKGANNIILSNQKEKIIKFFIDYWGLSENVDKIFSCAGFNKDKSEQLLELTNKHSKGGTKILHFEDSISYIELSNSLGNKTIYIQHDYNKFSKSAGKANWVFNYT